MSKSLDFSIERRPKSFSTETSKEKQSNIYMDWILRGKREKIKDTPVGIIKSVVEFDKDADFNHLNSWSGPVKTPLTNEDLDELIMQTVEEALLDNLIVPADKNGEPLGGMPENGDTVHVTYGNFVIDKKERDGYIDLAIGLPMKYELIKGKIQ